MKKLNIETLKKLSQLEAIVTNHSQKTSASKIKYKKLSKSGKKELQKRRDKYSNASTENLIIDIESIIELQNFILNLLSIILDYPSIKVSFSAPENTIGFIAYILKDKNFKNHIIYSLMNEKPTNIIGSNIISLLFFYIFKDKKITVSSIKHFLSMYIVKSGIKFEVKSKLTTNQKVILNQLKTGIKEEKEKNQSPSNNIGYRKTSKHFSIIDDTNNFIKIKYISNLNNKHRFHKTPIEHERNGHYRHYKNGKTVWISSSIINKKMYG